MKTKQRWLRSVCVVVAAVMTCVAHAADVKGHLFIVGGGRMPAGMLQRFVDLAGGTNGASIVVMPMASEDEAAAGASQVKQFKTLGVARVEAVSLTRAEATNDVSVKRLEGATGVFFTGGDQSRLAAVLVDSPVQKALKKLYARGAVIGGTSAGAAIMSEVMITGEELLNRDKTNPFTTIQKKNVQTTRGLGLLTTAVVDQHFIKRKRLNRLFSVVLENPKLVGIGIDESTAIILNPDDSFEVLGLSSVMVIDGRRARGVGANERGDLSGRDLKTYLLVAGDKFELNAAR